MAGSAKQREPRPGDITQFRGHMSQDPLVFRLLIRRQFSALSQAGDKPVDQGGADVDFINVQLGRSRSVFRMNTAATVQHQRDPGLLGYFAEELKVKSRTLTML